MWPEKSEQDRTEVAAVRIQLDSQYILQSQQYTDMLRREQFEKLARWEYDADQP